MFLGKAQLTSKNVCPSPIFLLTGKSTTLGILSGDIAPTSGEATIVGNDILTEQVREQDKYIVEA